MDVTTSIALGRQVLLVALLVAAPVLGIGLAVGVCMSLFQTITSISEQTLTMVPKILSIGAALFVLMPYIIGQLLDFATGLFLNLSRYGGAA